jgi:tetratricopeptide (TPR) repeat protein
VTGRERDRKFALPAFSRTESFAIAAVILAAVATFANSLFNGFALDDNAIIAENPRVHQLEDQSAIWLTPYWPTFGRTLGLWRPLTIFGYSVQWALGDGAPWVFHAVNVSLHALASVLVFLLLRALTSRAGALAGALLFAVHPLHTEVVANVVGQAEMWAAISVIGAAALWAGRPGAVALDSNWRTTDRSAEPAIGRLRTLAITIVFALGMLAKEGAIVLPPLLVALDLAQRRLTLDRRGIARWFRAVSVPMLLLAAVLLSYFAVRVSVLGSIGGMDAAPNLPFLRDEGRIFSAFRAWPEYVRLLFFPFDLSADYSPGVILPATGFTPMIVFGMGLLAVTAMLALATPFRQRAGISAAWFLIAVLPVSNLLFPIGVLLAERILYLPSVAVALMAGFVWTHVREVVRDLRSSTRDAEGFAMDASLGSIPPMRVAYACAAIILVSFAARSIVRNPTWDSTETVWAALVEDHPESYRSQFINGEIAERAGHLELARDFWELALRMWPSDPALLNRLAIHHLRLGNPTRALELLDRSNELIDHSPFTEILRAYSLLRLDDPLMAMNALSRADQLGAPLAPSLGLRAQALERTGQWNRAVAVWQTAVRQPGGDNVLFGAFLARALAINGRIADAHIALGRARSRAPRDSSLFRELDLLSTSIESGCFAVVSAHHVSAPPGDAGFCPDPLQTWGVVLPAAPQEVASPLQNATTRGVVQNGGSDAPDSITR